MEHAHSHAAPPDRAFEVLRDPQSLARFVPQLTKVESYADRVEVEARYEGRTQQDVAGTLDAMRRLAEAQL